MIVRRKKKKKKIVCQQNVFTNQQRQKMKSVLGHNLAEIILKMKIKLIQTKIQKKKVKLLMNII